jgi:uncharacterized repeat protein (TIGR02543 family)
LKNHEAHHKLATTRKNVRLSGRIVSLMLLTILAVGVFSAIPSIRSESLTGMQTGINYEGPYDWYYGVTDDYIDKDFQLFKANNVNNIVINIIWSAFQTDVNPASYNSWNIDNVKRVLAKAEQYDINVCISFFQYWMDTTTGVPSWCIDPWTGDRRYIAIVRNATIKEYFLEMVGDLVDEFKGSSAISCWSLLNEPMHSGSYSSDQLLTEREEFHFLIEEGCGVIRERDSRPITVRFTLPYSPWHTRTSGAYDTFVDFERVIQSLDFISINTYANPDDYGTSVTWQGTTWSEFEQAVEDTKSAGKMFWVSEFGNKENNEKQREHYESAVQLFQALGVDACFSWVWVHNTNDELYNICKKGGEPRPAFFELNLGSVVPEYTLVVNTVGSGSVTRSPDQATYVDGTEVSLTAVAAEGWVFSGWSGDASGSVNPMVVTVVGDMEVTATFTEEIVVPEYTLVVNTVGSGSVTRSPDQATYVDGTEVSLTAVAAEGWVFSGWIGDASGSVNPMVVTVVGDMEVTATFTEETSSEMSVDDWENFWTWLKQNPPGWQKKDWADLLEIHRGLWQEQEGILEMTIQDWYTFWEWLKQNPSSAITNTNRWSSVLEENFEKWKTDYL